jgi:hypothetical protein
VARSAIESFAQYRDDPEVGSWVTSLVQEELTGESFFYDDDDRAEAQEWVADLLAIPNHDAKGRSIDGWDSYGGYARWDFAYKLIQAAAEARPETWAGREFGLREKAGKGDYGDPLTARFRGPDEVVPLYYVAAAVADELHGERGLRLINVDPMTAVQFIRAHHSMFKGCTDKECLPLNLLIYAVGVVRGSRLVAVGVAGHPTGPWKRLDQRNVLELHRIASDGSAKGAAGMIAARMLELAPHTKRGDPDGPWMFVTYQLDSEAGDTYRSLQDRGLRPTTRLKRGALGGGQRQKKGNIAGLAKIRWEAGPLALAAKWALLE